jgi:hypothetical protein
MAQMTGGGGARNKIRKRKKVVAGQRKPAWGKPLSEPPELYGQ